MKEILVLKGDGVGEEIINSALKVLEEISNKSDFKYNLNFAEIGGDAIDKYGDPFPEETKEMLKNKDAVLLGAVGGPKWDNIERDKRPEKGLLRLRKEMGVYINLRPAKIYEKLLDRSPIKNEIVKDLNILVVRELLGGIYFGKRDIYVEKGIRKAYDVEFYDEKEIKRIAKYAFIAARDRRKKLSLIDKANVLDSSKLWREVVKEVHEDFKDVELEFLYVDNASMQLIKNPRNFDVILTNNIFGDILSDELSEITGSIGLLPSASIGDSISLYEPIHGSAPDIAGKNIVNPIATILSVAMMLKFSFNREDLAKEIEESVKKTIEKDILSFDLNKENYYTTKDITDEIIKNL
ncbi:3-isopropylmalate dehydrogenase [Peptoniphilus sp. AGMB00490]|uniref:3-isopropylmalate dehydrogenase n=1 Tax=Peptoniphilus faecalis TaxID=2731255 RepID=A0A848RL61_9FIRM|nr:3-isopropylmalate dehydrogenase [Peptoniphilus faecalis]NMW84884.1 3-isopropylmalate dehydrogenase [Peptoniphilus faecalis]